MFSSLTASVVFTAMFVATGGWALFRLALQRADTCVDRSTELAHLLMSLAMLAMVWGVTGGLGSASGIVQVVVFGLFSLWFLTGVLGGHLPSGLHLASTAAMVWMVVAMPSLMGMGHIAKARSDARVVVMVVTVLVVVLLAAVAGLWVRRAVAGGAPMQVTPAEPAIGGPGNSRTAVRVVDRVATRRSGSARLDASCHALMNLGMGAVLVAMF